MDLDTLRDHEHRITNLEIKLSFADDTIEQLNAVVVRQQEQIDRLIRQLVELRTQAASAGEPGTPRSLRDDLPPHY